MSVVNKRQNDGCAASRLRPVSAVVIGVAYGVILTTCMIFMAGCGKRQIPANLTPLFDSEQKLLTNQAIRVFGLVEYDTPENSWAAATGKAYAMVKVGDGEFKVVLDATGEEMAKKMDMKTADIRGYLTGESSVALSMSLTSMFSGTASKLRRIPELKVEKYEVTSLEPATARLLANEEYR